MRPQDRGGAAHMRTLRRPTFQLAHQGVRQRAEGEALAAVESCINIGTLAPPPPATERIPLALENDFTGSLSVVRDRFGLCNLEGMIGRAHGTGGHVTAAVLPASCRPGPAPVVLCPIAQDPRVTYPFQPIYLHTGGELQLFTAADVGLPSTNLWGLAWAAG